MKMGCLVTTSLADLSLPIWIEIGIRTMTMCFRTKRKWRRSYINSAITACDVFHDAWFLIARALFRFVSIIAVLF